MTGVSVGGAVGSVVTIVSGVPVGRRVGIDEGAKVVGTPVVTFSVGIVVPTVVVEFASGAVVVARVVVCSGPVIVFKVVVDSVLQ